MADDTDSKRVSRQIRFSCQKAHPLLAKKGYICRRGNQSKSDAMASLMPWYVYIYIYTVKLPVSNESSDGADVMDELIAWGHPSKYKLGPINL